MEQVINSDQEKKFADCWMITNFPARLYSDADGLAQLTISGIVFSRKLDDGTEIKAGPYSATNPNRLPLSEAIAVILNDLRRQVVRDHPGTYAI